MYISTGVVQKCKYVTTKHIFQRTQVLTELDHSAQQVPPAGL